ncbi:MAG TPA: hypothetical protein VGM67_12550 [Gemmatimonadaceae bacterium]|jgi:hypothetical protein
MNEERFDELMRDAAQTFRSPPEADFDGMWAEIDRRTNVGADAPVRTRAFSSRAAWMALAATLVIGVALGRASMMIGRHAAPQVAPAVVARAQTAQRADSNTSLANNPYEAETSRYLGQTAALLIALPSEAKNGRANEQFVGRAGDLLTTTRLLLDSPASDDPNMRNLLEDLELVLAQVVRLPNTHNRTELELINRALEQRDVIPRLRTAVSDNSAN